MLLLQISIGVILILCVLAIVIPLSGFLMPAAIRQDMAHSYFIPAHQLGAMLLYIEDVPSWRPEVCQVKRLDDALTWQECYGRQQCITYHAQIEDNQHIIRQFSIKNTGAFKVNRTYKIWERDQMSFLRIEDQLIIQSPYLRTLAFLFYQHKKFLQRELKAFERFVEDKK